MVFAVSSCRQLLSIIGLHIVFFFFFKQKTADEMRISDWSSDVCSSDLKSDIAVAGDAARAIFDYARRDKAGGKPWFQVVGLVNPHDIMFYDATGKQAESRPDPNALGPLRREPGDPLYEVDNKFDLPASFYKDEIGRAHV